MALGPRQVAPELLSKVTKALGITALDQWYYVSHHAVKRAIGVRAFHHFGGSVADFLKAAYPGHRFDEEKLTTTKSQEREQKFIEVIIRKLFPNTEIHTKARKAVGIVNPETEAYLEIDFWIPSLKLGIEYQDRHHYEYQWYANGALADYQKRDDVKRVAMPTLGYTLINIGFWWDKTVESLVATIKKSRPDLLQDYKVSAEPIPSEPPSGLLTAPVIPGVVGLMSPFIPGNDFDPTNWYAGEKHDGVRGVYNPELHKMFSRSGKELSLVPALLKDIPSILVEGEITAGRSNYNKTVAVSYHTYYDKVKWALFRYVIFDIPNAELGDYTKRYSTITKELMGTPFVFAQLAFRVLVTSKLHLRTLVDTIIRDAGEGAIVQNNTPYEYGRAKGLAKIKIRRDADAQVLSINKLYCTCKLVSGVTAAIPFSADFDLSKLAKGDIVSFYHNGNAQNGNPKNAEIYKVRYDVTWEHLISDAAQTTAKRSVKDAMGSRSLSASNAARKKTGHWNKSPNVRAFFDTFARTNSFDALVPANWYLVKHRTLHSAGGSGMLKTYGYSFAKALSSAYPELKFEKEKFRTQDNTKANTLKYWKKPSNMRTFFEEFARTAGFNPFVPQNWYPVKRKTLYGAGGSSLLKIHGYNLRKALSRAYPELKFEAKFYGFENSKGHWSKPETVRRYFDEFARAAGFDPLVPKNWYSVKHRSFQNARGGGLLNAHKYSVKKALTCAYPELKFEDKFRTRLNVVVTT